MCCKTALRELDGLTSSQKYRIRSNLEEMSKQKRRCRQIIYKFCERMARLLGAKLKLVRRYVRNMLIAKKPRAKNRQRPICRKGRGSMAFVA